MTSLVSILTLPLLAALATILLPQRAAPALGIGAATLGLAAALGLTVEVWRNGAVALHLGGWAPPLGIMLAADGLGAAMMAMTALVMTGVAFAARFEMASAVVGPRAAFGFWPLMFLLWGALNAVFVSRDLFNLYVGIELLSLAAIALVALGGKPRAIEAGLRYMVFALAGSLLYLAGVALTYGAHGVLDIGLLASRAPAATDPLALALMTAGMLAKTALFPFHVWLPPAHAAAPAPASALLSALAPKASFVIMLRLWFEAMPNRAGESALDALALLGAAAVVWGGVKALAQGRLKQITAYSTVAQLGYLCLVFPLAGGEAAQPLAAQALTAQTSAAQTFSAQPWAAGAWTGAIFLMLSHGLAKAAMFLTAGVFIAAVGSDRLRDLRGLARVLPMTSFAFALSAITLMGLPPSGGFTAKYLLMTSAFASGAWLWALVLAGGGLLAAAYLYRPVATLFASAPSRSPSPIPRAREIAPLVLAVLSVALGILSAGPFELIQAGRPQAAVEGL